MKLFKFSILSLFAAMVALTSCSDEGYWDGYKDKGTVYSFAQDAINCNYTPATIEESIIVTVNRNTKNGADTLAVAAEFDSPALSAPAEVVFADGSNTAELVIAINGLGIGDAVSGVVAFDEELVSVAGSAVCEISVALDYTWVSAGSCQALSQWAGNEAPAIIPIEKAAEGNGLYRLNSPYYHLEPDYCPKEGFHVQFYLDENYNALGLDQVSFIGEELQGGDAVLYWSASGAYGCQFINQGNTYQINAVMAYTTATGGLGLHNYETILFVWDEGYPGAN